MSQQGDGTIIFKELGKDLERKRLAERLDSKARELRDDMHDALRSGQFQRQKALKELREACAAFVGADEGDRLTLDRLDDALSRYLVS